MRSGNFTMYGGTIVGNGTAHHHRTSCGIILAGGAFFTMHGGSITGHNRIAVFLEGNSDINFTMNGGAISNNAGNGIEMQTGTMTMNGGSISDNDGMGINVSSVWAHVFPEIEIAGGAISGNMNSGIRIGRGRVTMSGGTISDNEESGVTVAYGIFYMISDDAIIKNNRSENAAADVGGGGISLLGGFVNIAAGQITGNTAQRGAGFLYERIVTLPLP